MQILFIQLGRIGDMILATPLFRAIKEKYPDAEIHVLAGRHNYPIIKDNPRISRIIVFEKSPLKMIQTILTIRETKYEYLIDPKDHHSTESRFIARIAMADRKIGYNGNKAQLYDFSIPAHIGNSGRHYIEKCFNSLKFLSIFMDEIVPRPELFTSTDSDKYVESFLARENLRDFILINISASRGTKLYVQEKWEIVINHLISRGSRVVITFAPTEKKFAEELFQKCKELVLFNSRSINDVISLVKKAKILITPDTSLVHIASAFNTPLIGLFGGLEEEFQKFKPLSDRFIALRSPLGVDGIKGIEANEVIKAIDSIL
jgi:ADP-heptose:LPS heptosyltransferase